MLATPMLLEGSEWLIVLVLVGLVLVFGPDKIPQIAKQVGRAKAEFDKASNEAKSMLDTAMKSADQEASSATGTLSSTINEMKSSLESTVNEVKSSFDTAVNSAQVSASAVPPTQPAPVVPSGETASVPPAAPQAAPSQPVQANEVDADGLLKLAHRMGIDTAGKTRDEISEEIFSKSSAQTKA
ncbi:MAG TPA: twin-arginine translocase TatA/TatE family subunit [Conexivisphaerales archaeon]|nr:twin-arginine translocase TatA/TatE family subunit [Conexivisphaerales archaeon]